MTEGIVTKSTGSWYDVKHGDTTTRCTMKGKFRLKDAKSTNPIAVGDRVDIEISEEEGVGVIANIHERKNYIIRKSTNLSREAHVIAANIDVAWLMITVAFPKTVHGFIDRFLVSAEAYRIPVKILFNKIDLYNDKQNRALQHMEEIYTKAGYECYRISVTQNIGIEELKLQMKDKVNVISGNSGVGKSTLISTIDPTLELRTGTISDYHQKGKHTTTFAEMFELNGGGYIIDTPGIKGFGIVDIKKEELTLYFPEMFKRLEQCKYYNCTHVHEPECAVLQAVESGEIATERYLSYLSMYEGDDDKYRKNPY